MLFFWHGANIGCFGGFVEKEAGIDIFKGD